MKTIGDRFRFLRDYLGLTQHDIANDLEISREVVANIETKGSIPRPEVYRKLSDLYKVNIHWMVTGEGEMRNTKGPSNSLLSEYNELQKQHTQLFLQTIQALRPDLDPPVLRVVLNEAIQNYLRVDGLIQSKKGRSK